MALIALVWTDGQPATGTEYGVGDQPLCCPNCGTCVELIIEATRAERLGWLLRPCHCILDAGDYSMDVTEGSTGVTVAFVHFTSKTQETQEHEAPAEELKEISTQTPRKRAQRGDKRS
jgi:hypothetical protein